MRSKRLISRLKKFFNQQGFTRAVVGLSGGIDSSVTLAIAVEALGEKNVYGLIMPEAGVSSPESEDLAQKLADKLGVQAFTFELTKILQGFIGLPWGLNTEANQNLRPRLRMALLYHFALGKSSLVLGTSNKSELLLGYGTKFGDFAADVEVLGNVWKTEVYALARELKIPRTIIKRRPSAELAPGQTDEEDLGASYAKLDLILKELEENNFELKQDAGEFEKSVLERVRRNEHKTKKIPFL